MQKKQDNKTMTLDFEWVDTLSVPFTAGWVFLRFMVIPSTSWR